MKKLIEILCIVLVAALVIWGIIALVDYCTPTPQERYERALERIRVVESPTRDDLKELVADLLAQEGIETAEIAISSGSMDGQAYITVHVLTADEDYLRYSLKGKISPIVVALRGDHNPAPNVWEGVTYDFSDVTLRIEGDKIILE